MSKHLDLSDLQSTNDLEEIDVEVPEWGGFIRLRTMTGEAKDAYEQSLFEENEKGSYERNLENARAKLIAACAIGPDGKRMFKSADEIRLLGNKSAKAIDRVYEKCRELNAISDGDVEEIAGN